MVSFQAYPAYQLLSPFYVVPQPTTPNYTYPQTIRNQPISTMIGNRTSKPLHNISKRSYQNLKNMNKILVKDNLIFGLFNAHSISSRERRIQIKEFIKDEHIDLLFITETWLKQAGDESKRADLCPNGYKLKSLPRETRAGGIAVIYKEQLNVSFTSDFIFQHSSFELLEMSLSCEKTKHIHFFCMYRPPPNKNNGLKNSTFCNELPDFLDYVNTLRGNVIILGDLNVHYNQPSNWLTKQVVDLFTQYDFEQGVNEATFSKSGNIIDWILYRESDALVKNCKVNHMLTSDHVAVTCTLNEFKPAKEFTCRVARNFKNINKEKFRSDIKSMVTNFGKDVTAEEFDTGLIKLIDQHAPEERKWIPPGRENKPWFPLVRDELTQAKRIRRRAERKWRKTGLTVHKQIFDNCKQSVVKIVEKAETLYYKSKINQDMPTKDLFRQTDKLLGRNATKTLPNDINPTEISETFSNFFQDKVKALRDTLDNKCTDDYDPLSEDHFHTTSSFLNFNIVSETDVKKEIMNAKSKSCSLDPIPTSLLKEYVDELLPVITRIINNSLQSSTFPTTYKKALIIPLIKKQGLDKNILKNYRPVSNLSFLSKITEKIAMSQMKNYLDFNNLFPIKQSAYRQSHSTETALLRILNDLLLENDNNKNSILALLDLSSAFDTIDHNILLKRLTYSYGIKGNALLWLKSFLVDRSQVVIANGKTSNSSTLRWGVPQGSVLGPLLFILYTKPLHSLIEKYGISYQSFADDTQLHNSSSSDTLPTSISTIQNCISQIKTWMSSNKLKLNDEKTELLYIHSKDIIPYDLQIGDTLVPFSTQARNLGVIFMDNLSLEKHVTKVCRTAFIELRNISNIRQFLDISTTKVLMSSLVLSKLDYCNSLFYGTSKKILQKLQRVQNTAAKIVFGAKKYDHVSPLLKKLHWLPVTSRIEFKIASICYKFFTDTHFPKYLSELLHVYEPKRTLRSSNDIRLLLPKSTRKKTFGDRSFSYSAPHIWNSLPYSLRHSKSLSQFKTNLKTFFFRKAYLHI